MFLVTLNLRSVLKEPYINDIILSFIMEFETVGKEVLGKETSFVKRCRQDLEVGLLIVSFYNCKTYIK